MKVTKQNYERYLIDFMDGTLDLSLKEDLLAFLDANPDIKEEFEGLDMVSLEMEENISFDAKEGLKQAQIFATENINERNYEEVFVASAENDLTNSELMELDAFLDKNPALASTKDLYAKTKVSADISITYPEKKKLKKYPIYKKANWIYTGSAAASIALLIGLFTIFSNSNNEPNYISNNAIEQLNFITIPTNLNIELDVNLNIIAEAKDIQVTSMMDTDIYLMTEDNIQQLQSLINPKQQLAALELNLKDDLDIENFKALHDLNLEKFNQTKYASNEPMTKNKAVAKAIWGGLFGNLKNKKRASESGNNDQNTSRVRPLWVIASIGLERVNEVTGSNMRLKAKGGEEKFSLNNEYIEDEAITSSK